MPTSAPPRSRAAQIRAEHHAQKERAARQRRRKLVTVWVGVLVVLAAFVGIAVGTAHSNRQASSGTKVPPGVTSAGGVLVGSTEAHMRVVMYEDPQCPVCKRFEDGNGKVLADAIASGRVAVEYRMRSFLGPESVRAVNALAAAQAEGKFAELRENLFAHQPVEGSGGYTTESLLDLGDQVGITSSAYADGIKDMSYGAWVHRIDEQGSKDGNVGTPELRIDGKPLTSQQLFDEHQFRAALGL
jgi:protein-disulfide isomerase